MENLTQILEGILFASGTPKKRKDILDGLGDRVTKAQFDKALSKLSEKYNEESGVVLLTFNDKIQLSTNPKYGDVVSEVLTPLKEKELSKVLLEVLAIIAYKQPVTRLDIEKMKSTSAEYALSVLLKAELIEVVGRKDAVGKPVLYGTTDEFLKKFQLHDITELPDFEAVMQRLEELGEYFRPQDGLYRDVEVDEDWQREEPSAESIAQEERFKELERSLDVAAAVDDYMEEDELPDFLADEDYEVIE